MFLSRPSRCDAWKASQNSRTWSWIHKYLSMACSNCTNLDRGQARFRVGPKYAEEQETTTWTVPTCFFENEVDHHGTGVVPREPNRPAQVHKHPQPDPTETILDPMRAEDGALTFLEYRCVEQAWVDCKASQGFQRMDVLENRWHGQPQVHSSSFLLQYPSNRSIVHSTRDLDGCTVPLLVNSSTDAEAPSNLAT
mmetsp:Transcript_7160/g.44454  ORF Transcript_7160/g.44454 Transcript_7160/m.44454 type:complete len:195 (-) Transcript_7160:3138-3722(-)